MSQIIKFGSMALLLLIGCATAPKTTDERQSLETRADATLRAMQDKDPSLRDVIEQSAGYAVFPSVGKGGAGVGGAFGRGVLYERGAVTGYVKLEQAQIGAVLGGETFSELLVLSKAEDVQDLKQGDYKLAATIEAIALTAGAGAKGNLDSGAAVFVMPVGGLMVDVSISGQRFQFESRGGDPSASASRPDSPSAVASERSR